MNANQSSRTNQALHIDDPTYSIEELDAISVWNQKMVKSNRDRILVVTNDYSKEYFRDRLKDLPIAIIEQGFTSLEQENLIKNTKFSCAYSSPFIDYGSDRHANHSAWGARILIEEIIPKLWRLDSEIEVHLIGELGKNAKRAVSAFPNVKCHGYVTREINAEVLQTCHVSIYPRNSDHFRAVQKIGEYIGAGNPIVSFELVDTAKVRELKLGILVENSQEFVEAILSLKEKKRYSYFKRNVDKAKTFYSWDRLAEKLDLITKSYN